MNAKELRIGNYVRVERDRFKYAYSEFNNKDVVVESIVGNQEHGYSVRVTHSELQGFDSVFLDSIEPIPITEEWLVKFGATTLPHFTITSPLILDLGRNRFLSIGSINDANQMVWLEEIIEDEEGKKIITDLVCVHNFDYDGRLYVHKLQNIYFDLTGRELEYKL